MTAYYNENEPYAAQWLRNLIEAGRIAPGDVDERSIEDVRPVELARYTQCHFFAGIGVWSYALRQAEWPDDKPVWTGSCPCQPFSSAGKRKGADDERHLWPHWFHLISQCQPAAIFGEQVASKDGLGWLDLVQADLEGTGYASAAFDICAAGVGAPHIRQRLWFYAERMADANGGQRERITDGKGRDHDGQASRWQQGDGESSTGGDSSRLAETRSEKRVGERCYAVGVGHTDNEGSQEHGRFGELHIRQSDGSHTGRSDLNPSLVSGVADTSSRRRPESPGFLESGSSERTSGHGTFGSWSGEREDFNEFSKGGVAYTNSQDQGGRRVQEQGQGASESSGSTLERSEGLCPDSRPGSTNGHWGTADWLFCRDGKWRPVEPGTSPLAHGVTNRVGRLRAYGNAIAAPVAEAFIRSVMECQP